MSRRWLAPCNWPGCSAITDRRYCPEHYRQFRREQDRFRPSAARRGYDRHWQAIRAAYLAAHPLCQRCGRPATEVDHIVPLARGGTHDPANLSALCKSCHSAKTAAEVMRGATRGDLSRRRGVIG